MLFDACNSRTGVAFLLHNGLEYGFYAKTKAA